VTQGHKSCCGADVELSLDWLASMPYIMLIIMQRIVLYWVARARARVCVCVCGCRWPFPKMVMLEPPLLMISAVTNSNHRCNMQLMTISDIGKLHTWSIVRMLRTARRLRGVSNFWIARWAIAVAEFQSVKHRYNWSAISTNNT